MARGTETAEMAIAGELSDHAQEHRDDRSSSMGANARSATGCHVTTPRLIHWRIVECQFAVVGWSQHWWWW